MAKDKDEKNIHDGHRERLLEVVYTHGFDALSKYEQVEFMLFYVFPRGDTNPLAHRLIDHFGSLSGILDADLYDLASVKGMGIKTAKKVKSFVPMLNRYTESRYEGIIELTRGKLIEIFKNLLENRNEEETVLVSLDKASRYNGFRRIAHGDSNSVKIEIKKVINFINSFNSYGIYIGHNHPNGKGTPSEDDVVAYCSLKEDLKHYGCNLKDSFIVSHDGVFSIEEKRFVYKRERKTMIDIFKND